MAISIVTISTDTHTLSLADDGKLLSFTSNTPVTIYCPEDLVAGFTCEVTQAGDGQVDFLRQGLAEFVDTRSPTLRGKGAHVAVTCDGLGLYKFNGEFTIATFLSLINQNASGPPTVTDDESVGYSVGSTWFDTTNDDIYDLIDDTTGSAVWKDRKDVIINIPVAVFSGIKPDGTDGGASVVGRQIRTLNTTDSDPFNLGVLNANGVILVAGTYLVEAIASAVRTNQTRLHIEKDGVTSLSGPNNFTGTAGGMAAVTGIVTTDGSSVFKMSHLIASADSVGLGAGYTGDGPVKFAQIVFTKIG